MIIILTWRADFTTPGRVLSSRMYLWGYKKLLVEVWQESGILEP